MMAACRFTWASLDGMYYTFHTRYGSLQYNCDEKLLLKQIFRVFVGEKILK